ncbi:MULTISPECIES: SDR family oxidoreductase [Sphingomonas]|jgi:2-keto-3-deoxy-L-fuconate dehydrogenase|uniref:SDR family oxidoreductase n=1 Tax=Sphingomonas zeae TaxID=1646122 RepID=A0A7Y6B5W9_9SPHN|nr:MULTISPECIES: SDR family oxidoreductase [Sphingomonas]MBB4048557.1 2-keto-3-deoxy-L-fuconate dehydrogenase [Sphingomonas zeae]MDK8186549.1 SDR family oxidoreductase [Sphingomonas zeae]MDK8216208.1 SDR family oxidoreductase [Sphingomonas sp. UMB7805-LC452B]NUU48011.1 SDR family oxidoreductase [Sphingomonas zeae]
MNRLQGKRAIVTGAGQGIGRSAAELFAAEGAQVIAVDRNAEALASLQGCTTEILDLTDPAAIAAFGERTGAMDVLFNCAGYVDAGDLLATQDAGYRLSFDLNVHAITHMLQAFLPAMIAQGRGSIVNMSSVAGALIGVPNRYAYCASKGAVAGITRSVALDYVGKGIRCNAICPGTVQSPSLDERLAATGDAEAARAAFVARQPMGRLGKAEEVAALALYLASDESAYTTGQMHAIDGGWTMA